MDWTLAISRNREALLIIIADLFALAGMRGNVPERLSSHAYHAICHVLKAAVRRLIFLAISITVTVHLIDQPKNRIRVQMLCVLGSSVYHHCNFSYIQPSSF